MMNLRPENLQEAQSVIENLVLQMQDLAHEKLILWECLDRLVDIGSCIPDVHACGKQQEEWEKALEGAQSILERFKA